MVEITAKETYLAIVQDGKDYQISVHGALLHREITTEYKNCRYKRREN